MFEKCHVNCGETMVLGYEMGGLRKIQKARIRHSQSASRESLSAKVPGVMVEARDAHLRPNDRD